MPRGAGYLAHSRFTDPGTARRLLDDLPACRGASDRDDLAALISEEPSVDELVTFYAKHERLCIRGLELNPYSFVFRG